MITALVAVAVLAGLTVRRIRRAEAATLADHQHRTRIRTAEQVMADVARWRADRRMREAREDRTTCEALWNLPTVPQQRKET